MRVGGVSFVGIVFINEGMVAPLSLFRIKRKNKNYHPRVHSTNNGSLPAQTGKAPRGPWGGANHHWGCWEGESRAAEWPQESGSLGG